MTLRYYANAPATTLTASIDASATLIKVASASGFPVLFPYVLILDEGELTEEVVLVTGAAGLDLTVTRGFDSTTAFAHSSGSGVVHGVSAIEFREANQHVNSSAGVHGIMGAVVGTTDAQVLTNKTLSTGTVIQSGTTINSPAINGGILTGVVIRDTSILQGNVANSQNPLSIRTVAGAEVGLVGRDGRIQAPRVEATSVDAAVVPLAVTGFTGQTASLATLRTSAGAYGIDVNAAGRVGIGRTAGGAVTAILQAIATGDFTLRLQRLAGQTGDLFSMVAENGTTGLYRIDKDGERVPNVWIPATLSGNRQPLDTFPQYRKVDKWVELRGSVGPNPAGPMNASGGFTLFTLPVGFRPAQICRVACAVSLTGTPVTASDRVDINTNGDVVLFSQQNPNWAILDGVQFSLD